MSTAELDFLLGPVQIGYTISLFLFGLITVQTYLYYQDFSDDPGILRILVAALWLINLAHELCCSHLVYFVNVISYGNIRFFDEGRAPRSFDALIFLTGLSVFLVMAFYNHRLWAARQQKFIATVLSVLLAARFVSTLVLAGFAVRSVMPIVKFIVEYKWLATSIWILGAVEDVIMTLALCHDWHAHRRSEIYQTSRLVDRLVVWCVGTGMLTSVVAVALSICFAFMASKNLIWVVFFFPMPQFFLNSLLVTLNARNSLQSAETTKSLNMESQFRVALSQQEKSRNAISVEVAISQETDREEKHSHV